MDGESRPPQTELAGPRESERSFRALANSIPQLAWMADATGWIFWYNDRWYSYTRSREELRLRGLPTGATPHTARSRVHHFI
jgi:PAS domain-containing protein